MEVEIQSDSVENGFLHAFNFDCNRKCFLHGLLGYKKDEQGEQFFLDFGL